MGDGEITGRDLIGTPRTDAEVQILDLYRALKALCEIELPPVAEANLRHALAAVSNVVNGLALEYEHLIDIGV